MATKHSRLTVYLIGLLLAPLLFGCGVISSLLPEPTTTPIPTDTPTPLPSPTATLAVTPTTPATPTPALDTEVLENTDGTRTFIDHQYGYAISFPVGWLVLELGEGDFEELFAVGAEEFPQFEQFETLADQLGPGGRIVAANFGNVDVDAEFLSNVNVLVLEMPGISLEFLVEMNAQSVPQLLPGAEVIDTQVITNSLGTELGLISYNYLLSDAGPEVYFLQAYLLIEGQMVAITGGTTVQLRQELQPVFEGILDSVELLGR